MRLALCGVFSYSNTAAHEKQGQPLIAGDRNDVDFGGFAVSEAKGGDGARLIVVLVYTFRPPQIGSYSLSFLVAVCKGFEQTGLPAARSQHIVLSYAKHRP